MIYKGEAKRLTDYDLPRIGKTIGVGEDVLHALLEVETRGTGYDNQDRVIMLFEPHKFYKHLKGEKRTQAVSEGLAYPKWGQQRYPRDSYPRLDKAMAIDETAALKSASWGLGQIMGENHRMAGFSSVQDMVLAFAESEASQLEAMIEFIKANNIDDDLRRIEEKAQAGQKVTASDWIPVVRVYNGAGYAKNDYHNRAAKAFNKWLKIKDTPAGSTDLKTLAVVEETNAADEPKGTITGNEEVHTEGTPPPTPAMEIRASRPTLKSTAMTVVTFLMAPLTYFGIDVKELAGPSADFAKNNIGLTIKLLVGLAFVVLAAFIWKWATDHANQRTLKAMDKAADPDQHNVRLV